MADTVLAAKLALYEKVVATIPGLERKGATMPYTSRNGHMFSFLTKEGVMALRLSEEARIDFLKRFRTKLCEQHGTVMKEYVVVPASLLKKTTSLSAFFELSYEYVGSLKPKATTRKKKAVGKAKPKRKAKKKTASAEPASSKKGGHTPARKKKTPGRKKKPAKKRGTTR